MNECDDLNEGLDKEGEGTVPWLEVRADSEM